MSIVIEAVYEDGVLKPATPLPLNEHEKVQVTIHTAAAIQEAVEAVRRSYGLLRWTGDPELLRRIAEDDEFGIREAYDHEELFRLLPKSREAPDQPSENECM